MGMFILFDWTTHWLKMHKYVDKNNMDIHPNITKSSIFGKLVEQIHIKFSMGILHNIVGHKGITLVVNNNTM